MRMTTLRLPAHYLVPMALILLLACCKKEDSGTPRPDQDLTAAMNNFRAEYYFADALKQADIAYKDGAAGCIATAEVDMEVMPHTMLVDFGTTNCTAANGLARRGRLLVTFTGAYAEPGTVITITPDNYHVNDHLIQGVKTITNAGANEQDQTHFTVSVSGTVTTPDSSWTSTHNYQRTRTWVAGEGTPTMLDDAYLITGGGNGIDRNGGTFTVAITTPLRVEVGCPWIVSGVQEITPSGATARIIDFGNGACDQAVAISVGNFTFNIGG